MAQRENMIARPAGVRIMFLDGQRCAVMQEAVEDMGSLAHRGGKNLAVERSVLVGDMRVEEHPRINAVFGVDVAWSVAAPSCAKELAVRRRSCAGAPNSGHRLSMVRVDYRPERRLVRLLAQMPSVNPGKLRFGHALRSMGHPLQAEICAIRKDGGEQGVFVLDLLAGAQICKGICKTGAATDLMQE